MFFFYLLYYMKNETLAAVLLQEINQDPAHDIISVMELLLCTFFLQL